MVLVRGWSCAPIVLAPFSLAGSFGQPVIDLTANHHAGKFVFYDSDNPPEDHRPQARADSAAHPAAFGRQGEMRRRRAESHIRGWIPRGLFDLHEAKSDALMRQVALDAPDP